MDQFRFVMLTHSIFLGFQRTWILARVGTLDAGIRDSIGTAVRAVNQAPGMHLYWRQRSEFFQPEFRAWVEDLLASEPLAGMLPYWQNEPDGRANDRTPVGAGDDSP